MTNYRIELHGSTIDPHYGTLRMEVPSLDCPTRLAELDAPQIGALMRALIDTKAWLRAYLLEGCLPVATLYRERADKLVRELEPPARSTMYLTAGDPHFLERSGLADLPMVSDALTLVTHPWENSTLQEAHALAVEQLLEMPDCGAVVFHHGGEVVAAWERRHVGQHEPLLVVASARAVAK